MSQPISLCLLAYLSSAVPPFPAPSSQVRKVRISIGGTCGWQTYEQLHGNGKLYGCVTQQLWQLRNAQHKRTFPCCLHFVIFQIVCDLGSHFGHVMRKRNLWELEHVPWANWTQRVIMTQPAAQLFLYKPGSPQDLSWFSISILNSKSEP